MPFIVGALGSSQARETVEAVLTGAGHTSVLFATARSAVAEALAGAPDVLIVDDRLPDMTIMQVREAMRSQPSTAGIQIVVYGPTAADDRHVPTDHRMLRTTPWADDLRATVTAALLRAGVRTPDGCAAGQWQPGSPPFDDPTPSADRAGTGILLVEDDASIAEPLIDGLARHGIPVDWVTTGAAALSAPSPALILLDLGLPDLDGLEVCRRLRRTGDVPVIILTARGDECDRVVGLELGADDYLAKPFSVRELVARIRAVQRRSRPVFHGGPATVG